MNRRSFVKLTAAAPALAATAPALHGPASTSRRRAQERFTFYSPLAEEWYRGGEYFEWASTTRNNRGRKVQVFYRTFGDRSKPAVVMLHGYPTSSFDFRKLIPLLEDDYFVAVLDFPGFGFSDKPQDGYSYMLEDDARLVDHWVRDVLGLTRFRLLTHDRGGSVGFAFLGHHLDREDRAYEIVYHFVTDGGLFLPLANLSQGQTDILDPLRGPELVARQKARPRLTEGDPENVAYADIQAFNDGIGARLYVGKYLLERAENEYGWLDNLRRSPIPTALMWGLEDTVNPVRIGDHIWYGYLNHRAVESSYWLLPTAGHYPQRDAPEQVAGIVRTCLEHGIPRPEDENAFMRELARDRAPDGPIYVGRSIVRNVYFPGAVRYTPDGYEYS